MTPVAERRERLLTDLYDVQDERRRPQQLKAREAEIKRELDDLDEGLRARQQLVAQRLGEVVAEYSAQLTKAIERYYAYVAAMESLNTISAERYELMVEARKLGIESEIEPEAFDSFARRQEENYDLSLFHREHGIAVVNSGWPR